MTWNELKELVDKKLTEQDHDGEIEIDYIDITTHATKDNTEVWIENGSCAVEAAAALEAERDRLRALVNRWQCWARNALPLVKTASWNPSRRDAEALLSDPDAEQAAAWLEARERLLRTRIAALDSLADEAAEVVLHLRCGYPEDAKRHGSETITARIRAIVYDSEGMEAERWLEAERERAAEPWKALALQMYKVASLAWNASAAATHDCDLRQTVLSITKGAALILSDDPRLELLDAGESWLASREAQAREEGRREAAALLRAKAIKYDLGGIYSDVGKARALRFSAQLIDEVAEPTKGGE